MQRSLVLVLRGLTNEYERRLFPILSSAKNDTVCVLACSVAGKVLWLCDLICRNLARIRLAYCCCRHANAVFQSADSLSDSSSFRPTQTRAG